MQVKEHPNFESEHNEKLRTSYYSITLLIIGVAIVLYFQSVVAFISFFAIGMFAGLKISSTMKKSLEKQTCPDCQKKATLIVPKRYGSNYFSECIPCQVRWDLKVKHKPND